MSGTNVTRGVLRFKDGEDSDSGYWYRISVIASKEDSVECIDDLNVKLSIYKYLLSVDDNLNALIYDINITGATNPLRRDFLKQRLGIESSIPLTALDDTVDLIYKVYCVPLCAIGKIKTNVRVEIYSDIYRDDELSEDDDVKPTPASREAVDALEKVTIGESVDDKEMNCVVCLEEFSIGSEVTKMPCSHVFHGECIVKWLENRLVCPICRFALPAEQGETTTDI